MKESLKNAPIIVRLKFMAEKAINVQDSLKGLTYLISIQSQEVETEVLRSNVVESNLLSSTTTIEFDTTNHCATVSMDPDERNVWKGEAGVLKNQVAGLKVQHEDVPTQRRRIVFSAYFER